MADRGFRTAEVADVGDAADEQRFAAGQSKARFSRDDRPLFAGAVGERLLVLVYLAVTKHASVVLAKDFRLLHRKEIPIEPANHLVVPPAHEFAHRIVHDHEPTVAILDEYRMGNGVDDPA